MRPARGGADMQITVREPTLEAAKQAAQDVRDCEAARGWHPVRTRATREPDGAVAIAMWFQEEADDA